MKTGEVMKMVFRENKVKFKNSKIMQKLMNDVEEDNELIIRLQKAINDHKDEIWNLKVVNALNVLLTKCDLEDLIFDWM